MLYFFERVTAKNCDPSEINYEYTPCDQNGERWRIALPKSHLTQCDNLPLPKSGVNCCKPLTMRFTVLVNVESF